MKLKDALIAYDRNSNQIRVGHLIEGGQTDWTVHPVRYQMTMGAAFFDVRKLTGLAAGHRVMSDFIGVVVRDGVDIAAAHNAFLAIDEYRNAIPEDMVPPEYNT